MTVLVNLNGQVQHSDISNNVDWGIPTDIHNEGYSVRGDILDSNRSLANETMLAVGWGSFNVFRCGDEDDQNVSKCFLSRPSILETQEA